MRALVRDEYGSSDVLRMETLDTPRAPEDGVVIRVEAVSLNRSDWETLTGRPAYVRVVSGYRRPRRRTLGSDVAGTVVEVGDAVTDFAVGDEVLGDLLYAAPRCLADHVSVTLPAPLTHKPPGLSFTDAACLPQAGSLALQALTDIRPVGPGDRVLVIGAGGGGGTFAIQLARHFGAVVDGVDRPSKLSSMRSLGATDVFDFTTEDFSRTSNRYDRIVDFAGRRPLRASRRFLTDDGVYFFVGGTVPRLIEVLISGTITTLTSRRTMKVLAAEPEVAKLDTLANLAASGAIESVVGSTFTLDDATDAMAALGSEQTFGKIVVTT